MSAPLPEPADAEVEIRLPPSPYPGLRPFQKDEWPIFFGRETMTDEVIDRLVRHRLVVVHGDSGCGKSSLIRAGVLGRLEPAQARGGNRWRSVAALPRRDPLGNLAAALAEMDGRKDDEARVLAFRRILNHGREAPTALAEALACNGRDQVCILIDQFEELFEFARAGDVSEARLLTDMLIGLLEEPPPGLYALVTLRSDYLGSCARFPGFAEAVNATQYLLPQMDRPALLRAIRDPAPLYEGEVSRDLAERLIADAGDRQDQLPLIQHGLMLLYRRKRDPAAVGNPASPGGSGKDPRWRLTSDDYSSGGGLETLLSDHADSVLKAAVRRPGSEEADPKRERMAESLFRALTDTNAEGQPIRRPQRFDELEAATGGDAATLRSIIDRFRAEGVSFLRPYGDALVGDAELIDTSHEALIRCWKRIADPNEGWRDREFRHGLVWRSLLTAAESFEKDPKSVLGPAVTAERERWLAGRSKAWCKRYGGGWDRVERLMKASRQAVDRQQRRDRFLIRTIGTVAIMATVLAAAAGYFWWNSHSQLRRANLALAHGVWNSLVSPLPSRLTTDELNSLWSLTADAAVRAAFVEQLKTNRGDAVRFGRRPATVERALGPDWPSSAVAESLLAAVATDMSQTNDPDALSALPQVVQALAAKLSDAQAQAAIEPVLAAIKATNDPHALSALAQAVQALPAKLSDAQAQAAIEPVLAAIKATNDPDALSALAQAVQALPAKLSDAQAQAAIEPVLAAIKATNDPHALSALAQAVQALPAKLSDAQAQAAIEPVLAAIKATNAPFALRGLAQAVQALAAKLSDAQAQAAIEPVLAAIKATNDPYALGGLAQAVQALAAKLSDAQAQAAIEPVLAAIKATNDFYALGTLAEAVQALAAKLSDAQAQAAIEPVLAAIKATNDPYALYALVQTYQALAAKLSDAQAQAAIEPVLAAIKATNDPDALSALAQAVQALAAKLSDAQAQAAIEPVLAAIKATNDPDALRALAQAVQALAAKLSDAQAQAAIEPVLAAIKATNDPYALSALAQAVQALAAKLSDAQAQAAIEPVLAAIKATNDPDALSALAQAVQALAAKLSDAQAQAAIEPVLAAIKATNDPHALSALAQAVQALPAKLSDAQAQAAIEPVLAAIKATNDPYALGGLAQAVQALAAKLSDNQRQSAAQSVRSALGWASETDEAKAWALALVLLLPREPAERYAGGIVEALKYFTTAGPATDALLDALHDRLPDAPGQKAGLSETLAWIRKVFPTIDAASPAVCPPPLWRDLACPALSRDR